MGLISPGGENLLDFLELRQVLSTYNGNLRELLWWPHERPVPEKNLGMYFNAYDNSYVLHFSFLDLY